MSTPTADSIPPVDVTKIVIRPGRKDPKTSVLDYERKGTSQLSLTSLDLNNPAQVAAVKTIAGEFSDLQLQGLSDLIHVLQYDRRMKHIPLEDRTPPKGRESGLAV